MCARQWLSVRQRTQVKLRLRTYGRHVTPQSHDIRGDIYMRCLCKGALCLNALPNSQHVAFRESVFHGVKQRKESRMYDHDFALEPRPCS